MRVRCACLFPLHRHRGQQSVCSLKKSRADREVRIGSRHKQAMRATLADVFARPRSCFWSVLRSFPRDPPTKGVWMRTIFTVPPRNHVVLKIRGTPRRSPDPVNQEALSWPPRMVSRFRHPGGASVTKRGSCRSEDSRWAQRLHRSLSSVSHPALMGGRARS